MAWNTLTFACGHTEQVQLYGKMSERDRQVAAALHHDCPACRAANAQAAAAEASLPALTGSEKQVGWAGEVRAKLMPEIDAMGAKARGAFAALPADQQAARGAELDKILRAVAIVKANTKAGWWIDQRQGDARSILITIAKTL